MDAVRSGKKHIPAPPDWVSTIMLAQQMNKMPSDIDEEPMEWVARLAEYFYHANRSGN